MFKIWREWSIEWTDYVASVINNKLCVCGVGGWIAQKIKNILIFL